MRSGLLLALSLATSVGPSVGQSVGQSLHSSLGSTPAAPTLPELAESLTAPRLVGTDLAHELGSFSVGALRISAADRVYPVVAGSRRVGYFLVGGRFELPLRDPLGAATFELNLKRASPFKPSGAALSGPLEAALLLDSAASAPAGEAPETPLPDAVARAFERHLERFARVRLVDPPNRIAQALLDSSGRRVAIALIVAGRTDLLYHYDDLALEEEALSILERYPNDSALRGERYPIPLVARPSNGEWLRRDPPRWRLTHVDLDLLNPEEATLDLTVSERIEVLEPLDTLGFSLWSEIYHERQRHEYRLDSVALAPLEAGGEEVALPFSHRNGDLVVRLPERAEPGDELVLRFRLAGELLQRPGGHSYWWLPIGSWLPLPPRFDMRAFTLRGVARAAQPFVPFGMGTPLRRWEEPGLSCLEFALAEPVQFAVVMAGRYHSYTTQRDDQTITLSSYAFQEDEPMQRIAENVFELIDWYEERLGTFPYPDLDILEINAYGFGIGPPGVLYLTREGFDPGPSGRSFRREINRRLAHEVAHMWWGHVAQMASPDDQWLSESTAEYFAALAVDELVGRQGFRDAYRDWQAEAGNSKAAPSLYMANRLAGERAAFDRRNLLYGRGPLMLHALREQIGDRAFFETLRRFVDEHRHRHIDTAAFIGLASEIAGRDLAPWFDRELFGLDRD